MYYGTPVKRSLGLYLSLVVVLLIACARQPDTGHGSDGPLGAVAGAAMASVHAPGRDYDIYDATFGGFLLCLKEPGGGPVVITDVRPVRAGQEFAAVYLRTVTPAIVRKWPDGDYFLVATKLGRPPFNQPYASPSRPLGEYTTRLGDVPIEDDCDTARNALAAVGPDRVPKTSYTELMLVISATSEESGVVNGFVIEYSANGKKYTMSVPVKMIACDRTRRMWACR
jgi:hypothetical protein